MDIPVVLPENWTTEDTAPYGVLISAIRYDGYSLGFVTVLVRHRLVMSWGKQWWKWPDGHFCTFVVGLKNGYPDLSVCPATKPAHLILA